MIISINSNIAAVRSQRLLGSSSNKITGAYQRLTSGQRINKASHDAAGLAIAESLRSSSRLASVAVRNAQDGISAISMADGALASIAPVLSRLGELTQQFANVTYPSSQMSALHNEFQTLGSEIERIAVATAFNGKTILSGTQSTIRENIQAAAALLMDVDVAVEATELTRLNILQQV
jgi:flagellin